MSSLSLYLAASEIVHFFNFVVREVHERRAGVICPPSTPEVAISRCMRLMYDFESIQEAVERADRDLYMTWAELQWLPHGTLAYVEAKQRYDAAEAQARSAGLYKLQVYEHFRRLVYRPSTVRVSPIFPLRVLV